MTVTVKADKEGEMVNCASVSAIPRICVSTMVGKAQLAIRKTGPETRAAWRERDLHCHRAEHRQHYRQERDGDRSGAGRLPVRPAARKNSVSTWEIWRRGASKVVQVTLRADKRGKFCNKAFASSSNGGKVDAEACTTVVQAGLKIEKKTDNAELFINRAASCDIVVSNTGDVDLTGVVVTDTAASDTVIATAEGCHCERHYRYLELGRTLRAGEKKNLSVKVLSRRRAASATRPV